MRRRIHLFLMISLVTLLVPLAGCTNGVKYIFNYTKDLKRTPADLGLPYRDVWFYNADGNRLHGWHLPGETEKPVVLFFHGNAANLSYRVDNLAYLHRLGVSVFIFDYRGYGQSEGRPRYEEDLYVDGRAAVGWLENSGWQPERMIFFGRSLGAAVALQLALETSPARLIIEAPFTSLAEIAWHVDPWNYGLFGWWNGVEGFDNLGKVARLVTPLTIIQGEEDPTVPPEMARRLFEAARGEKTALFIPRARHSDCYLVGGAAYRELWLAAIRGIAGAGTGPPDQDSPESSSNREPGSAISRQSSSSINSSAASPGSR